MRANSLLACALTVAVLTAPEATPAAEPVLLAQRNTNQQASDEQTSINVYNQASPAVVTIEAGGSLGSGSIISADGLVLTNEHVVRSARRGVVRVRSANGNTYEGQVVASDRRNDLALVRLQTSDRLPFLQFADRSDIQVGQRVYAIGSPFGLSGTFTTGILSRIAPNGDLQTDAAINQGNSGGPLLNSNAELIGVNKAIITPSGGNVGIGFATSAPIAREFVAQNQNRNAPTIAQENTPRSNNAPPRLGVEIDASSLTIAAVQPGSLADRLGLRQGDRIVAVNYRRLRNAQQLVAFLDTRPTSAVLTVARNRRLANLRVNFQ